MKKSKKTKTHNSKQSKERFIDLGRWGRMNYRDLQREAIKRGMPFPDVIESDMYGLIGYIEKSIINKISPDQHLIEQFDDWMDDILKQRNIDRFPSLRLSYVQKKEDIIGGRMVTVKKGIKKPASEKKVKEKKPPRAKDSNGLVSGTKKSYTYELVKKGKKPERIIKKVIKKFPDANPKSINIWIRKAENELKTKNKKKS